MLTNFRRQDLDRMFTSKQVREKFEAEGNARDSIYPMALGWIEGQAERAREIAREALDEVDKLRKQLEAAEAAINDDDASYWETYYGETAES